MKGEERGMSERGGGKEIEQKDSEWDISGRPHLHTVVVSNLSIETSNPCTFSAGPDLTQICCYQMELQSIVYS